MFRRYRHLLYLTFYTYIIHKIKTDVKNKCA
nr:MAG TPA: hypothetical protein [Caudoviricetes sp.]